MHQAMSNMDELQRRITTAMDRVAQGLDRIGGTTAGPDPELEQALEDERTANAQLEERVRALKAKSEADLGAMRAELEETLTRISQLDTELQRLRQANKQLTDACAALRDANDEGVGDPHLVNKAMLAELDGLRAARASDVAESSAIIAALAPLVHAAGAGPANGEETS